MSWYYIAVQLPDEVRLFGPHPPSKFDEVFKFYDANFVVLYAVSCRLKS